jgi:hypothetical protein
MLPELSTGRNRQPSYRTIQFPVFTLTTLLLCFALLIAGSVGTFASTSSATAAQADHFNRGLINRKIKN